MNSVKEVQEVLEITVDSNAAKKCVAHQKKGVVRTKSQKEVELAATSGSAFRVEGDAKSEFIRGGNKCCLRFLDADVKSQRDHRWWKQGRVWSARIAH